MPLELILTTTVQGQELDPCRNPMCVSSRAKTNKLVQENEEAKVRVASLEKVVLSQKEKIQVLEVAKQEAVEAIEVARAEVNLELVNGIVKYLLL